jgi:hypothetical protein
MFTGPCPISDPACRDPDDDHVIAVAIGADTIEQSWRDQQRRRRREGGRSEER